MRTVFSSLFTAMCLVVVSPALATTFTPNLHLVSLAHLSSLPVQDEEPSIRVDSLGRVFVSTIHGLPAGTDLFQVAPNGLSYTYRGMPDGLPIFNPNPLAIAPGGGDTDLAVDSFSPAQPGPLIVTSLNLATTYVSTTQDGGQSYLYNPNAAGVVVGQDRQWNAAQGGLERYTVVHDLLTDNVEFARSLDGGLTWINGTPTTASVASVVAQNNEIGPIAVDAVHHILYNVFVSVSNTDENLTWAPVPLHTIWVARSTNDGTTWGDHIAYNGPVTASYNHLFPSIAVDGVGNVFVVWSDDHDVWLVYSTTEGGSWSKPIRVTNSALDGGHLTHIYPWIVAGADGGVDIVYYETIGPGHEWFPEPWVVGFAQSLNVIASPTFSYAVASDHVIHDDGICEGGIECTGGYGSFDRNLADDFQIALDPHGYANIAYTDDHNTGLPPQVYFTKQNSGYSIGTPNGDAGPLAPGSAVTGVTATGARVVARVKAPSAYSPGWLTVLINMHMALAGFLTTYSASSSTSAVFAGVTRAGVPFAGSITGGVLRVNAALSLIQATITGGVLAL